MHRLIKFPLDSGGFVYIEIEDSESEGGLIKAGLADEAAKSFESSLSDLSSVANAIKSKLIEIHDPPDEVDVEFGITLNCDAGLVITKVGTEANFKVHLKWSRNK